MADVAIIGAGSWGIALAKVLHTNGNKVTVWSIVEDEITMLKEKHEHVQKLPGVKLPEDMEFMNFYTTSRSRVCNLEQIRFGWRCFLLRIFVRERILTYLGCCV